MVKFDLLTWRLEGEEIKRETTRKYLLSTPDKNFFLKSYSAFKMGNLKALISLLYYINWALIEKISCFLFPFSNKFSSRAINHQGNIRLSSKAKVTTGRESTEKKSKQDLANTFRPGA